MSEYTKVILNADPKLVGQTVITAREKALQLLQDSDEFFLITLKDTDLSTLVLTTDLKMVIQGFYNYLKDACPKELHPSLKSLKAGLDITAELIEIESILKETKNA